MRAQGTSAAAAAPAHSADRKKQIDRTLATTRTSTASMGKFDKTLEGEKKLKGVKRKVCWFVVSSVMCIAYASHQFDPTEVSASAEKSHNLAILQKLDREPATKKAKRGDDVLNVRKAIRSVSKGKGSAALAREGSGSKAKRGRR